MGVEFEQEEERRKKESAAIPMQAVAASQPLSKV
jgi:hypothetical protein